MNLPLYRDHQAPKTMPAGGHRGLWYERFFDRYDDEWKVLKERKDNGGKIVQREGKASWVEDNAKSAGNQAALDTAVQRQLELVTRLGGRGAVFKADWHFATGLGLPHPVENGLAWHHTLGVPYLSGSAVKGLVRAWVEIWDESLGDAGSEQRQQRLDTWFGNLEQAGAFLFFDALPIKPVNLRADVMTPHMGKWYEQGGEIENWRGEPHKIPADWHAPVPAPFLVADRPRLLFSIAPRCSVFKRELNEVFQALKQVLEWLGAGAKTAVGYGVMQDDPESTKDLEQKRLHAQQQAEIARLSPEQQTLITLRNAFETHRQRDEKPDAGSAFMAEVRQLLGRGRDWPAADRIQLADLAEAIYAYAGWGSGVKKRQRKEQIATLRD